MWATENKISLPEQDVGIGRFFLQISVLFTSLSLPFRNKALRDHREQWAFKLNPLVLKEFQVVWI